MGVVTMRLLQEITVVALIAAGLLHDVEGADPVMTPINVTDSFGNSANINSTITWAPIPAGLPYTTSLAYDDGGLGPMFAFARSFINTVMSQDPPYDLIIGTVKGTVNIGTEWMKIVTYGIGFAVCVVIGFVFILIFPLVGCCFCCCRCCGNCGGNMKRRRKDTDNRYRIIYSIILAVSTIFVFVGIVCVYVTNGQVSTSITSFQEIIVNNLNDMQLFLNNTVTQITYLTSDSFNFTARVISRDLDNIGVLVGIPVRDKLSTEGGVTDAINAIIALDKNITVAGGLMLGINSSVGTLKTNGNILSTDLADVKTDVDAGKALCATAACNALDSSGIAIDVDFSNLPDISSNIGLIQTVLQRNLTELALKGKSKFDEIPEKVSNETEAVITQIKDLLNSFAGTIEGQVSSITSLPSGMGSQLSGINSTVQGVAGQVATYDKYRWYGGLALPCLGLIVVILQLLGILFGFCGYSNEAEAHERSGLSHSAGQLLMAASGFIFIFAALLMLLCTVLFLVGGLLEKVVCQPLSDPTYAIFNKLVDGPNGLLGNYPLGQMVLKNGTINLTIASVLNGCKKNSGAFSVLKLDSMFDLNAVTDYKKSINIQTQIDAINVDMSTVDLMTTDMEQQLRDFSSAIGMDFTGFDTVLSNSTAKTDLSAMVTSLTTLASDSNTPGPAQAKFSSAASKLSTVNSGIFVTVDNGKTQLQNDVNNIETTVANVPTGVNTTIDAATAVETYIGQNGTALVKTVASTYGNRILAIADSFATSTLNKVFNDVAGCVPVYNLFQSIFVIGLCKYIVDVLNGFWFSLGWIIFFETISVIFDIKLAKFLRRMKKPEHDNDSSGTGTEMTQMGFSRSNKVTPSN